MSNTLRNIQEKQTESTPDPHIEKQKKDLLASLKTENCVLTVHNCQDNLEGTEGWKTILSQCQFRNNFKASDFQNASINTTFLSGNRKSTSVTFQSKEDRDSFLWNVEKKNQKIQFYESFPIRYRAANKAFRHKATHLRAINLLTEISVNENYMKMYLRYKNRSKKGSGIQYDYKIDSVFDPFDREVEYSQRLRKAKN